MSHTQHPLTVEIHVPNAEALHELSIFLAGFLAKHQGAPHHGTFVEETLPAPAPYYAPNCADPVQHQAAAPAQHQAAAPAQHQAAAPAQHQAAAPAQHQAAAPAQQPSISFQDLMTLQSQLIETRCIDPAGILRIYGEYGYSAARLPQPHHFGAIYEKLAAHRRPQ